MSTNKTPTSLLVQIKATHFNWSGNKNSVLYSTNAATKGAKSWTASFPKPQLVAHDTKRDPIGRIVDYKVIKGGDDIKKPDNYITLTVKITDPDAIQKVLDGRYYTVSVGSSSKRVICSECDQVLTEDGLCEHKKGSYNEKGKLIYWVIDQIEYTENSFVNEPADEFAVIDKIKIGKEWLDYKKFVDSYDSSTYIFPMEDMMDVKLSPAQRIKLSESSFCGPNRSFPAHDKAHVIAGLSLLTKATLSDDAKAKIKASLYRKGKRYGIITNADEVGENFDILFRMEDEFTPDEVKEITDWFTANPDSDLPEVENADTNTDAASQTDSVEDDKDISKLKKDELVEEYKKLEQQLKDAKEEQTKAIELKDKTIEELNGKVQAAETIAYEKEDELNKYVDRVCVLEQKYHKAIISNIIDLKVTDNINEEKATLMASLEKRTVESLEDSLQDLRTEIKVKPIQSEERVKDPTQHIENNDENKVGEIQPSEPQDKGDPKFKIFSVDRRNTEVK